MGEVIILLLPHHHLAECIPLLLRLLHPQPLHRQQPFIVVIHHTRPRRRFHHPHLRLRRRLGIRPHHWNERTHLLQPSRPQIYYHIRRQPPRQIIPLPQLRPSTLPHHRSPARAIRIPNPDLRRSHPILPKVGPPPSPSSSVRPDLRHQTRQIITPRIRITRRLPRRCQEFLDTCPLPTLRPLRLCGYPIQIILLRCILPHRLQPQPLPHLHRIDFAINLPRHCRGK